VILCRLTGHSYIPTPKIIADKHCVINVQNKDDKCFIYGILAAIHYNSIPRNKRHKPSKYQQYMISLNYDEEELPMRLSNVSKFERMNPDLRVNIILFNEHIDTTTIDDEDVEVYKNQYFDVIYRSHSTNENATTVNLLAIEQNNTFHYMTVVDLNKLLNNHRGFLQRIQNRWCHNCLLGFRNKSTFEKHIPLCSSLAIKPTMYTLPNNTILRFTQWNKTVSPAYVVYADFESLLEPCSEGNIVQVHMPLAAGYKFIPAINHAKTLPAEYQQFVGEDCRLNS
jgi:hypothetical protein